MANNIKEVHLGAPPSISANECPNLETLDCQITQGLKDITLKGNLGTKGAIQRCAELLRQRMDEASIKESTWQGMTAHYGDNLADVIANGGDLQLSVHDADGNPVRVYWQIAEITEAEEGATATINQDGVLTLTRGKKIQGKVRAINWENSMEQVVFEFMQNVALIPYIEEYPSIVNSIVSTEHRNYIHFDRYSVLDSGILPSSDMEVSVIARPTETVNREYGLFGSRTSSGASDSFIGYINANTQTVLCRIGSMSASLTIAQADINEWFRLNLSLRKATVHNYKDGSSTAKDTGVYSLGESKYSMYIGAVSNAKSYTSGFTALVGDISDFIVKKTGETHHFVPCIKNGNVGMLDLYDLSFKANIGSGTLTISNK